MFVHGGSERLNQDAFRSVGVRVSQELRVHSLPFSGDRRADRRSSTRAQMLPFTGYLWYITRRKSTIDMAEGSIWELVWYYPYHLFPNFCLAGFRVGIADCWMLKTSIAFCGRKRFVRLWERFIGLDSPSRWQRPAPGSSASSSVHGCNLHH